MSLLAAGFISSKGGTSIYNFTTMQFPLPSFYCTSISLCIWHIVVIQFFRDWEFANCQGIGYYCRLWTRKGLRSVPYSNLFSGMLMVWSVNQQRSWVTHILIQHVTRILLKQHISTSDVYCSPNCTLNRKRHLCQMS